MKNMGVRWFFLLWMFFCVCTLRFISVAAQTGFTMCDIAGCNCTIKAASWKIINCSLHEGQASVDCSGIDCDKLLSGQVQIKSVKTGHVVGVDKANTGVNIFVKEDKQAYDVWDVLPNNNILDPYYVIQLANNAQYKWDNRNGCEETDRGIVIFNSKDVDILNKFYYNPITRLIKVCNGHCLYVDPIDKKLRAGKDCSDKEDKHFYIAVQLKLNLPDPTLKLDVGKRGGL